MTRRAAIPPRGDDSRRPRPPARLESRLQRMVAGSPSARFVVGDFREEYATLHRRLGGVAARLWYCWELTRLTISTRRSDTARAAAGGRPDASDDPSPPFIPAPPPGGTPMLESLIHDVRYGLRSLRRRPGLSLAAGAILALALGATTAIFSVVDAVLLKPLPFPNPASVVRLGWYWPGGGEVIALTPLKFEFWRDNSESFEALATYRQRAVEVATGDGEPRSLGALAVSGEFLRVIGAVPAQGRDFTPEETQPGGPPVAIIGDQMWRELLRGDPSAVGGEVRIAGVAHTVVGILSPEFRIPTLDEYTGLLLPMQEEPALGDRGHNTEVIGRLRDDLDLDGAALRESTVTDRFAAEHPDRFSAGEEIRVFDFLSPYLQTSVRRVLWILLAAVGVVLLIACSNVAGLLLVKAVGRQRELAARLALGASRRRLIRQILVESLILAAFASIAGTFIAGGALDLLLAMVPYDIPRLDEVGIDYRVLTGAALLALGVGTFAGTATALPASRRDPATALRESGTNAGRGRSGTRLHQLLVTTQVALSVAMLSAACVLLITLVRLSNADLGFEIDNLYSVRLSPTPGRVASPEAIRGLETDAVAAVSGLPGVESAAGAATAPLERGLNFPVTVTAGDVPTGFTVELRSVGPGYFRTLGTPLLRGRALADTDRTGGAPVVVVNQAFVDRLPDGAEALGAAVAIGYLEEAGGWLGAELEGAPHEIVGVVDDVKEYGAVSTARATVYVPTEQTVDALLRLPRILVRSDSPDALAPIRARLFEVEPGLRSVEVLPMSAAAADSISRQRFNAVLMGAFGAVALLLTLVGLYGMLADAVGRRVHEIGIRMALGARPGRILVFVLTRALATVAAGLILGLIGAVAAGRVLQTMTFEVSPTDPRLLAGVAVLFVTVALLACLLPARRATRIDPVEALRAEG